MSCHGRDQKVGRLVQTNMKLPTKCFYYNFLPTAESEAKNYDSL